MLRSLYAPGTSMVVQREKMDVITNNVANVETTGYKSDMLVSRSFQDVLISTMENDIGSLNRGIKIDEVVTNFGQGNNEITNRMTDFAISGKAFFVVNTPEGERYTRDGNFNRTIEGYLVTNDGNYVAGNNGPAYVGTGEFAVGQDGSITVDGIIVDKLELIEFENLTGLKKVGSNLYANTNNANIVASASTITQGSLEGSNVDITQELVSMMEVSRTYEFNQSMLKMIDQSLDKAVNDVGKV